MAIIKCVVSGDPCAGKSQAIMKFVDGEIVDDYDPSIEDSYRKLVMITKSILLDILDTTG